MPKFRLKADSPFRTRWGGHYPDRPELGHVDADTVVEADENPDPNHFEEDTETAAVLAPRHATTTTRRPAKRADAPDAVSEPQEAPE